MAAAGAYESDTDAAVAGEARATLAGVPGRKWAVHHVAASYSDPTVSARVEVRSNAVVKWQAHGTAMAEDFDGMLIAATGADVHVVVPAGPAGVEGTASLLAELVAA